MPLRTRLAAPLVLATALAGAALAQDDGTPSAATVVATVNGTEITLGEMLIARSQLPPQYQELPPDVLFDGLLEQLVNQQLLADALNEEPLRLTLALQNEARSLRAGEVVSDIYEEAVTEEALQDAYDEMFADLEPQREYNAAHILVETEEAATEITALLEDGADFAELARERSVGPSGPNGGDLGWFGQGMMVAPFEEAVMALEVGQVSAPVQTQFGWHVIVLNDTRNIDAPPIDAVQAELAGTLQQQALEARIAELTETGSVELTEPGAFDPGIINAMDLLNE
ncbi:MAG: peptidyl-prolyl cis-trans isomerase C [Rhodobacteraceae bacterium HLUCCA08]|nr:MAG: peptidyl-prolyl cis-trans isomerase C [Rhodobacteraceae bacterium HLUCCA08]